MKPQHKRKLHSSEIECTYCNEIIDKAFAKQNKIVKVLVCNDCNEFINLQAKQGFQWI